MKGTNKTKVLQSSQLAQKNEFAYVKRCINNSVITDMKNIFDVKRKFFGTRRTLDNSHYLYKVFLVMGRPWQGL